MRKYLMTLRCVLKTEIKIPMISKARNRMTNGTLGARPCSTRVVPYFVARAPATPAGSTAPATGLTEITDLPQATAPAH